MFIDDVLSLLHFHVELGVNEIYGYSPMQVADINAIALGVVRCFDDELWADFKSKLISVTDAEHSSVIDDKISSITDATPSSVIDDKIEISVEHKKASSNVFPDEIELLIKSATKLSSDTSTLEDLNGVIDRFDVFSLRTSFAKTVFGDGISSSEVMLIGEAPGEKEDNLGIPFCGRSGELLNKMLSTIGLSRESNIYITNAVFWRPTANRKPNSEEIAICRPFVEKHIAIIKPKLIIACGSTAIESLFAKIYPITKICGSRMLYYNSILNSKIDVVPLFHPSYLLRNSIAKKKAWFSLLAISKIIDELFISQ